MPVAVPEPGPEGAAGDDEGGGVGGAPPLEFGPGSPYEGETGAIVGGGDAEAAVDVGDAALELVCGGARRVGSFSVRVRPRSLSPKARTAKGPRSSGTGVSSTGLSSSVSRG